MWNDSRIIPLSLSNEAEIIHKRYMKREGNA
jgi:hypothetical protein